MNLCVVGVSTITNKRLCKNKNKNKNKNTHTHTNLGGHTHHEVTETHSLETYPEKNVMRKKETPSLGSHTHKEVTETQSPETSIPQKI